MFCDKCGNELNEGASFCPKCGNKIEANMAAEASVPSQSKRKNKWRIVLVVAIVLLVLLFFYRTVINRNLLTDSLREEAEYSEQQTKQELTDAQIYENTIKQYEDTNNAIKAILNDSENKNAMNKNKGADSPEALGEAIFKMVLNRNKEDLEIYVDDYLESAECKYEDNSLKGKNIEKFFDDVDEFLASEVQLYNIKSIDKLEVVVFDISPIGNTEEKVALCQYKLYSKDYIASGSKTDNSLLNSFFCHTAQTPDGQKWFWGNIKEK